MLASVGALAPGLVTRRQLGHNNTQSIYITVRVSAARSLTQV